jgi:tRNA(Arg) A34 adenosine deaminase TadA
MGDKRHGVATCRSRDKLRPMTDTSTDPFADVAPAWRSCFVLAWEAFQAKSIPVGAVLVDAHGKTVGSGRNRSNDKTGPAGHVAGSSIAHAEINALATLPPGDYADHTLYSTLEPCFLCTAALRHSHVGVVRFAAVDPTWHGVDRLPDLNVQMARRWTRREGPLGGHLQTWAAVLPLVSAVERGVLSVQQSHAAAMPEVLSLAREWTGATADRLRGLDLGSALMATWSEVAGCRR